MGTFFAHCLVAHGRGTGVRFLLAFLDPVWRNIPARYDIYHIIKLGKKQPTAPLIFPRAVYIFIKRYTGEREGCAVRQSYLKNAALMTGADVLLRLAGMGLRIWLANALGGEGMGLYQLVLAVYSLFVTLATAGVSVAATRLMAEELARSPAEARGMLHCLLLAGAGLGVLALAAQFWLAGLAAKWWLGDVRAAGALRVSSLGLPWMAVSSVLRGFFIARRQVEPNVLSQLAEQTVRIGIVYFALERADALGWDVGGRCTAVLGATAVSEAVSTGLMALFYRKEARRCFGARPACRPQEPRKRLWDILWPVEGGRCLASALHTAENMLVPACLAVYLQFSGGRAEAVAQYGNLKGMALPLLTFPFGLLGSLSVLLMPEITRAHTKGDTAAMRRLIFTMLRMTGAFSLAAGAGFVLLGAPLAGFIYRDAKVGRYVQLLGFVAPFMYLESMVDGVLKGLGEQLATFRYSLFDSVFRIAAIWLVVPQYGMMGFLGVMAVSYLMTCGLNMRRMMKQIKKPSP